MPSHIFHIGCMKTGTTTIQEVLANDNRLNFILHSRYFNTNKYFEDKKPDYNKANINIESDEGIVRCYAGLYGVHESIKRIHKAFPKARILITIREQRSLLISGYKHHIRQTTDNFTFKDFLNSSAGISYLQFSNYAELFRTISEYYNPEQIFFLPFEVLKHDYDFFFGKLYNDVLGLKPPSLKSRKSNAGDSDRAILFKRKLNGLILFKNQNRVRKFEESFHKAVYKGYRKLVRKNNKIIEWPAGKLYNKLEEYFRKSNVEFQNLTKISLKPFNYLL